METDRRAFIEDWPLYTKAVIPNFHPPENISRRCPKCGKETTWTRAQLVDLYVMVSVSGNAVRYRCVLCNMSDLAVIVRAQKTEKAPYATVAVQKIGQYPPPSIDIPSEVEKRLGADDAVLYKNALVCRSQGFGIGALAYIRRVVENKTNELIEVLALQAESMGIDAEAATRLRAIKNEKVTYDERLRLGSEAIPGSLKPDGANPLAAVHGLLSEGMHARTEEQCLGIADEIKDVFEYVFARLRAEIEDRNTAMTKIKHWAGNRRDK